MSLEEAQVLLLKGTTTQIKKLHKEHVLALCTEQNIPVHEGQIMAGHKSTLNRNTLLDKLLQWVRAISSMF
jgi:hypothetical protein